MQASFKPKPFFRSAANSLTMVKFLKTLSEMFFIFCKEPDNKYFSLCEKQLISLWHTVQSFKAQKPFFTGRLLWACHYSLQKFWGISLPVVLVKKKKSKFSATLHSCYNKKSQGLSPDLCFNHITDFIPPYTNFRTSRSESRSNKVTYKEICFFLEVTFRAHPQSLFQCHPK